MANTDYNPWNLRQSFNLKILYCVYKQFNSVIVVGFNRRGFSYNQ